MNVKNLPQTSGMECLKLFDVPLIESPAFTTVQEDGQYSCSVLYLVINRQTVCTLCVRYSRADSATAIMIFD